MTRKVPKQRYELNGIEITYKEFNEQMHIRAVEERYNNDAFTHDFITEGDNQVIVARYND